MFFKLFFSQMGIDDPRLRRSIIGVRNPMSTPTIPVTTKFTTVRPATLQNIATRDPRQRQRVHVDQRTNNIYYF